MLQEFVFESAPFPQAHAATIAQAGDGDLVCAWFGGTREGARDVGIWLSRRETGAWTRPVQIATGEQGRLRRYPCWNPVLHQEPGGLLLLFYKIGASPSRWWGVLRRSHDGGRSWSEAERLPDGILGPIKNKPIRLADGTLLCPSSAENDGWRVHMEWTGDLGGSWHRSPPLNDRRSFMAIQPTVLAHRDGRLQLLCRTRQGAVAECWSVDGGRSWSAMRPTHLPNPDSGIDAATLADGSVLLVYNHVPNGRSPLNVAISSDGVAWMAACVLERDVGEFSYPSAIIGDDGRAHIVYTWNRRRIRYVALDVGGLRLRPLGPQGDWPDD